MKKYLLFILAVYTLSCNSDDELSSNSEFSEFISENKIDTDINFMPVEIYNTNELQEPILKLKLVTSKIYPCINFSLSTTEFIKNNELIIRFEGIIESEICLTAIGPAMSYVDLPKTINKITFINGNSIDTYSIEINQNKISISPIENRFTNSLYSETFRIPENSFAYVCGTNTNNTNIYSDFLAVLSENPNIEEFEFEGEGRIPYPLSTDGNWVNHPSRYFTYSNFEKFKDLGNILNEYSIENIEENSGVTIAIYSWNNINYYSWIDN